MKQLQLPAPIRVRKALETDINFIFSSWLESFRKSRFAQDMHNTIYFTEHHKIIENLLKTCDVWIACSDVDPSQIFGFLCCEVIDGQFVLHYAYVKHDFRMLGIGSMMLSATAHNPEVAGFYTHHTLAAMKLAAKYRLLYSPYLSMSCEYRKPLPEKTDKNYAPEDAFEDRLKDKK